MSDQGKICHCISILHYYITSRSPPGFVVDGFEKFVGMGLVQRSMQEMLRGKKDQRQIRASKAVKDVRNIQYMRKELCFVRFYSIVC